MKLNYKLEGNGKTLVFIHGLSDSLLYWQPLINSLKDDYQILRFDLRGHGLSKLSDDEITMDTYVNDLLELLDKLKLNQVNLVGFSLGSAIALEFTIRYPQRVSSLVMMSGFYKSDKYLTDVFNSLKKSLTEGFPEFFDTILPMILCPDVIEDNKDELDILKKAASADANVEAYLKAVDVCLDFDVEDKLHHLKTPTLILAGKYDEITVLSMQEKLHNHIENSSFIVFDDVKHNLLVGKNINMISTILEDFF